MRPASRRLLLCASALVAVAATSPARAAETLRFAAWKYGIAGQEDYYRDLAAAFEKAYPNYKVQITLDDWSRAFDKYRQWTSDGRGPDLAVMPDIGLAEYAPWLDRYVSRLPAGFTGRFRPVMLDRSRYRGEVLGLVWAASAKALFYRTDLFRAAGLEPPATWDELLAAARKLNRPPQVYGLAMPGAPEADTADNFYFFLWSNGGNFFDERGQVAITSPRALEALEFYRSLALKYGVTQPDVARCNRGCAEELFAQGKAAMVETGPWGISKFAASPAKPAFAVAPLPKRARQITQLVTDHLVLFRNSRLQQEALEFIRFAYQPSWRLRWARLGMLPELTEVASDEFFSRNPSWRVFASILDSARWVPMIPWKTVDRTMSRSLGEVLTGQLPSRDALERVAQELESVSQKEK